MEFEAVNHAVVSVGQRLTVTQWSVAGWQSGSGQCGTEAGRLAVRGNVGQRLSVKPWLLWDTDWQSGSGQCGTEAGEGRGRTQRREETKGRP